MASSRRNAILVMVGSAVLAFAWASFPAPPQDAVLANMDVLYQLHRVQQCLGDWPHVSSLDTYSHAGRPHHVHWLNPHSLFLAAIARIAGAGGADVAGLARVLGWVPPACGAIAAACAA